MLIDSDGSKKGVINFSDALKVASEQNLDLVQVSPKDSIPVVCKIMDYCKYVFSKKKNLVSSKKKKKKQKLKEIKFRPNTDTGDFNIKLKK